MSAPTQSTRALSTSAVPLQMGKSWLWPWVRWLLFKSFLPSVALPFLP